MVHRVERLIGIFTAVVCTSSCGESAHWEPTPVQFDIVIQNNTQESRFITAKPYDIFQNDEARSFISNRLCSRCGTFLFDVSVDYSRVAIEIEAQSSVRIEREHVWYETVPAIPEICADEAAEECRLARNFAPGLYEIRVPHTTREMVVSQGLEETDRIEYGGTVWYAQGWGRPLMDAEIATSFEIEEGVEPVQVVVTIDDP